MWWSCSGICPAWPTSATDEGEKAAVIGINGAGKTTLFKIITGEYEADNGEVIFQKGSTYGYLSQVIDVSSHRSIYEEMLDAKKEIIEMEKKIRQLEKEHGIWKRSRKRAE